MQINQSDVELFNQRDPHQTIRELRQQILPKLKRLRVAALNVAKQRLSIDTESFATVERPANRSDAKEVVFSHEAYIGVTWPRSRNPLAVKTPDGKPRFYPPTYLFFGLYPDGHLQVKLVWYRYKLEASFRKELRVIVESQAGWLLNVLSQRGIHCLGDTDEPLEATLDRPNCVWSGKPLALPIMEGDTSWNEAIEDFVMLLPFAKVAWDLALGEIPDLTADCLALREQLLDIRPNRGSDEVALPDEVDPAGIYLEGSVHRVLVNAYERNLHARRLCVEHHGTNCSICGFNFGSVYGEVVEGFIHVHHLRPLSEIGGEYQVDPIKDLRPVCPNCHAVAHKRIPAYSIAEVRELLDAQKIQGPKRL